jgi:BirA family biotin operon repressor/biotin-[acetyl-CoA-carboxylase] ligase
MVVNNVANDESTLQVVCEAKITELLDNFTPDVKVNVFDKLNSTNQWLMEHVKINPVSGVLCVADEQSDGRGRSGRKWVSPGSSNIYMSLSSVFVMEVQHLAPVSLVVGLAIARVLRNVGVAASIKWPNDVLIEGKKVAGVLIEVCQTATARVLVVGIGLNVRMHELITNHSGIESTYLEANGVTEKWLDRNLLITEIYKEVMTCLKQYYQGGFVVFQQEWIERDAYYQRNVRIMDDGLTILEGFEVGVDEQGRLLIEDKGQVKPVHSGDLSLREIK